MTGVVEFYFIMAEPLAFTNRHNYMGMKTIDLDQEATLYINSSIGQIVVPVDLIANIDEIVPTTNLTAREFVKIYSEKLKRMLIFEHDYWTDIWRINIKAELVHYVTNL